MPGILATPLSRRAARPLSPLARFAARWSPATTIRSGAVPRSRWVAAVHTRDRATASLAVTSARSTSMTRAACGGVPRRAIVASSSGSSVIAPRPLTCSTPVRPGTSAANEIRSSRTRLWRLSVRLFPLRSAMTSVRPSRIRATVGWSPRGLVSLPPTSSQVDSARNWAAATKSAMPGPRNGPSPWTSGACGGGPGGCHRRERMTACAQCTKASVTSTNVSAPFRSATEPLTRNVSPTPGRRKTNDTGPCASPSGRVNEIRVGECGRTNPGVPPMNVVRPTPSASR